MFSGIVQNQGLVTRRRDASGQARFAFRFKRREKGIALGESIAVDGVCLTVAKKTNSGFEADVMADTLNVTTLSGVQAGGRVNLERALRAGDRISGHYVTGHVDGVGRIRKIARAGKNRRFFVEAGPAILKYAVLKGSMALDGVSLTVQEVSPGGFWVALVPHTLAVTTLREKKTGDAVNLEIDLMARYPETEQKPGKWRPSGLSVKALKAQGF